MAKPDSHTIHTKSSWAWNNLQLKRVTLLCKAYVCKIVGFNIKKPGDTDAAKNQEQEQE